MLGRAMRLVGVLYGLLAATSHTTEASPSSDTVSSTDEIAAVEIDREWVWQRYHSHLMSPSRSTPFVVYFTDDSSDCSVFEGEADGEELPGANDQNVLQCQQRRDFADTISATLAAAADANEFPSSAALPIVHITKSQLLQAFALHRIPSTPSLMWFPPRSSGKFQRYAHAQTNFLDLSMSSDASNYTLVTNAVVGFLRRSFQLSSLPFPTSNARAPPPEPALEDTLVAKLLNLLPFFAIGLYALLAGYEYRSVLLKVVRNRFTWLVLTQCVLYVSFSGLFHSIIHRVAPFYAHPQYGFFLIHPSGRKQFFIEGLLNGAWGFVISWALFSIVNVMPTVRSTYAREEMFRMSLIAVGIAYACLHLVFMSKHPWLAR